MRLGWTVALVVLGVALCGLARWQESRPRPPGEPPLVPPVLVLSSGVLLLVLAGAHLVTLLTGVPLKGQFGPP